MYRAAIVLKQLAVSLGRAARPKTLRLQATSSTGAHNTTSSAHPNHRPRDGHRGGHERCASAAITLRGEQRAGSWKSEAQIGARHIRPRDGAEDRRPRQAVLTDAHDTRGISPPSARSLEVVRGRCAACSRSWRAKNCAPLMGSAVRARAHSRPRLASHRRPDERERACYIVQNRGRRAERPRSVGSGLSRSGGKVRLKPDAHGNHHATP